MYGSVDRKNYSSAGNEAQDEECQSLLSSTANAGFEDTDQIRRDYSSQTIFERTFSSSTARIMLVVLVMAASIATMSWGVNSSTGEITQQDTKTTNELNIKTTSVLDLESATTTYPFSSITVDKPLSMSSDGSQMVLSAGDDVVFDLVESDAYSGNHARGFSWVLTAAGGKTATAVYTSAEPTFPYHVVDTVSTTTAAAASADNSNNAVQYSLVVQVINSDSNSLIQTLSTTLKVVKTIAGVRSTAADAFTADVRSSELSSSESSTSSEEERQPIEEKKAVLLTQHMRTEAVIVTTTGPYLGITATLPMSATVATTTTTAASKLEVEAGVKVDFGLIINPDEASGSALQTRTFSWEITSAQQEEQDSGEEVIASYSSSTDTHFYVTFPQAITDTLQLTVQVTILNTLSGHSQVLTVPLRVVRA